MNKIKALLSARMGKKGKLLLAGMLLLGVLLMLLPQKKEEPVSVTAPEAQFSVSSEEARLQTILCTIRGAGKVSVYLAVDRTEEKIYGQNEKEKLSSEEQRESQREYTYLDDGKADSPLLLQTVFPQYRGAIIAAEGASDPLVRLALTEAVSAATGLSSDKIQIVIMDLEEDAK